MYIENSILATVRALQRQLPSASRDVAEHIGQQLVQRIAAHTPVAKRVDEQTGEEIGQSGRLKRAWRRGTCTHTARGYTVPVINDCYYARWVNDGTRPHIIEPRADRRSAAGAGGRTVALRFWSHGELMFRRRVKHPGTRGHHMVQKGAADVEREWLAGAEQRYEVAIRIAERQGVAHAARREAP